MGQRHVEVGRSGANDFGGRFLVDGIGVSEQEAYGDGLDAIGHELRDRGAHVVHHQRLDHLALEADPLADLENSIAREQHLRRGREDVEDVLAAPLPADLVDVAETARGQQSDPNALAFEQGVERGGRAVQDQRHRVGAEVAGQVGRDVLHHGGGLRRIGEILANGNELALILIERSDVGEGPADVDADTQCHRRVFFPRNRAVASRSMSRSRSSATP